MGLSESLLIVQCMHVLVCIFSVSNLSHLNYHSYLLLLFCKGINQKSFLNLRVWESCKKHYH